MTDDTDKSEVGLWWRLGEAGVLLVNIIGLPLRLFWEWPFRGVGLFCFLAGIVLGGRISSRVRAKLKSKTAIAFFIIMPVAMIAGYLLYIDSVNHVVGDDYSLSLRQFWEFFLYGFINFCWGLCVEVAARVTKSLGKSESGGSTKDKPPSRGDDEEPKES